MYVWGTCGFIFPHPASPEPLLEFMKEQRTWQPPTQGVGGGWQGASRSSPTFLLCLALTTATAMAPSASTRARGTSVETSTVELPPCPAELEERSSALVMGNETWVSRIVLVLASSSSQVDPVPPPDRTL